MASWYKNDILILINAYKQQQCLYNMKSKHYI